ncbi:MAG: type II secretion system protein GspH [Gammaproteobacteria bacterium HGW-Gammaproteobacteria-14]|nr:MAG: type II secretion system protein GspH [Gammaproteobacteria bacterium HGW-Gammaproteobacteria-14]
MTSVDYPFVVAALSPRVIHYSRAQRGFTLLEILVVVVLMAAVTTLLAVGASRGSGRDVAEESTAKLRATLELLTESSLFRGELLALRLDDQGWEPLRFEVSTGEFEVMADPLARYDMPEPLQLEWEMESPRDATEVSISTAAENLFERPQGSDEPELPQFFFFPSGETSAARFMIRNPDSGLERVLKLDPLGRAELMDDGV